MLRKCQQNRLRKRLRKWKTPRIEEIAIGLEINAYACADL